MDKEEILKVQIEAVNVYIDTLIDCENRNENKSSAYLLSVNIFRQQAGKGLIKKKETLEIFKRFKRFEE